MGTARGDGWAFRPEGNPVPRLLPTATCVALLALTATPPAAAAGGSCMDAANPLLLDTLALTVHAVNAATCSGSASCSGCTTMKATITVSGLGYTTAQMLASGPGGTFLVGCVGYNGCTDSADVAYITLDFYCEGTSGRASGSDPNQVTVALGAVLSCSVE